MFNNISRVGNFTSSEIYKLMSNGKEKGSMGAPAISYIEECNMERRLGRSLQSEVNSRPISWGNLVECAAFNHLGLSYKLSSKETIIHPDIDFWSGSPDGEKFQEDKTVFDIKCPMTLKSFCQMTDCKTIDEVRKNHKDGEKYYWQLVSNSILTKSRFAELIIYVPYLEELKTIRELASNFDGNQNKIAWINWADDNDLPYLIEGNHYKNINIIRFEVLDEDKKNLTNRIIKCGEMLSRKIEKEVKYFPTQEQKMNAQEKIRLMKELKEKMKANKYMIAV